jgi:hypothetical protein
MCNHNHMKKSTWQQWDQDIAYDKKKMRGNTTYDVEQQNQMQKTVEVQSNII